MALLNLEEDPWLIEHESCEKLSRDIMEQLTQRQKFSRTSNKYSELSANIRLRLKQYNNEVGQLDYNLKNIPSGNITSAEVERRERQIEVLRSKSIQMLKIFDDQVVGKLREDREQLMNAGPSNWGIAKINAEPVITSVNDLRSRQKQMLGEQDKGLENLSQIISRQKTIAQNISEEVEYHNEILDDLGNRIDNTDQRVRTETHNVSIVDQKDNTCVYWVIIILLFISIIVVSVL